MDDDFEEILPLSQDTRISLLTTRTDCFFSISIRGTAATVITDKEVKISYSKSKHEIKIEPGKGHKPNLKKGGTYTVKIKVPTNIDPPKEVKREAVESRVENGKLFIKLPWDNDQ